MEVSGIAAAASALAQARTADAVQVAVLRKAMDIQSQGALQLLQALPAAAPANPPHLGNRIDVFA